MENKYFEKDKELLELCDRLYQLRKDGVDAIAYLKQENTRLKQDRLLSLTEREKLIAENNAAIAKAKILAKKNAGEIKDLQKQALQRNKILGKEYCRLIEEDQDQLIKMLKTGNKNRITKINSESLAQKKEILASYQGKNSKQDKLSCREDLRYTEYIRKSEIFDAKNKLLSTFDQARDIKSQAFAQYIQKNISIRNGKVDFFEKFLLSLKTFKNSFHLSSFMIANGLFLTIILFFVACIIIAPLSGNGNLLSIQNLLTIFEQASVRVFYALGVAGLILLAGTDLSVGRMAALGAIITGIILHPGANVVTFFGLHSLDFSSLPVFIRLFMSLFFSIFFCVLFSAFAGVFTAKLKIHPFISTLATQLIIYGLLFIGTSGTPVGSIDNSIKDMIGGRWVLGSVNGEVITFPKLIIPAIIAIVIAWFIWNKTVFGKKIYAVGGNPEAASVSGINVFMVTMGVFVMAGVFYGIGGFFEAFKANASAGTGQGYELDAIAACVVGGISFSGGIGKISGAVVGVIIFTALTYCMSFLGIDTNLQFVFKGLIIIFAVALDRMKYLKKR